MIYRVVYSIQISVSNINPSYYYYLLLPPLGNFPNDCDRPRIVQYITFYPNQEDNQKELERRLDAFFIRVLSSERPYPTLTLLGKKIVGMVGWKTGEKANYANYPFEIS